MSLPQQPFHRCLLPSTTCYENLGRVTNPHAFTVDGVSFMGTSGQNIDDVMKYVDHEDRLGKQSKAKHLPFSLRNLNAAPILINLPFVLSLSKGCMAATLEWCHSTPTAPDTVPCFPFQDKDPFLMQDACPHVYFVGNQPKLETGLMEGPEGQRCRLISLPAFSQNPVCVLVNLQDLSCHPITFSTKSLEVLE